MSSGIAWLSVLSSGSNRPDDSLTSGERLGCQIPSRSGPCLFSESPDSPHDHRLLAAIQEGLPLVPRPYAEIGRQIGLNEETVIEKLKHWVESGVIKRFGVIVRHRKLG